MPNTSNGETQHTQVLQGNFYVTLKRGVEGLFTSAGGLSIEVEVVPITYTDATGKTIQMKRPGQTKYSELSLKRHLSADQGFWKWIKEIRDGGKDFRSDGSIELMDRSGQTVSSWTFLNAWPSKWSASDPDVGSDDPMSEEVTLVIEGLTRTQ